LEAEAIYEGRDDEDVRPTREGEFDAMERAKNDNQPSDVLALVEKAMEKLTPRQPLRAMTEGRRKPTGGRRGRDRTAAPRHGMPTTEGSVIFFFFFVGIALRARGRKQG
jgi:hypothetical protein